MSTHTFDNHYVTCPVCQKNTGRKPVKTYVGLYTCPYCQERLVVCKSGHYVRDPFLFKQILISSTLRRQSRPLSRILRDFVLLRPVIALALGSAILLSTMAMTQQSTSNDQRMLTKTEKLVEE
ncbi:MAG: hypothetical protein PUP91_31615 [Rhizonema sp. PD37]|nr:hypothetical protein [Rhizonema sp. PD37]